MFTYCCALFSKLSKCCLQCLHCPQCLLHRCSWYSSWFPPFLRVQKIKPESLGVFFFFSFFCTVSCYSFLSVWYIFCHLPLVRLREHLLPPAQLASDLHCWVPGVVIIWGQGIFVIFTKQGDRSFLYHLRHLGAKFFGQSSFLLFAAPWE